MAGNASRAAIVSDRRITGLSADVIADLVAELGPLWHARHQARLASRRERGRTELPAWKEAHNRSHKQVRARVEHVFARMKTWKILPDCRLKGEGVHYAMLGIARMHNLALAG
ncbi:transposase [Streptomyces sp. SMS_SU21]|uniref:transposase n=1 Tax=Streptomyces sp. SMS_SU21 TaxID=2069440 RepID=UPI0035AB94B1